MRTRLIGLLFLTFSLVGQSCSRKPKSIIGKDAPPRFSLSGSMQQFFDLCQQSHADPQSPHFPLFTALMKEYFVPNGNCQLLSSKLDGDPPVSLHLSFAIQDVNLPKLLPSLQILRYLSELTSLRFEFVTDGESLLNLNRLGELRKLPNLETLILQISGKHRGTISVSGGNSLLDLQSLKTLAVEGFNITSEVMRAFGFLGFLHTVALIDCEFPEKLHLSPTALSWTALHLSGERLQDLSFLHELPHLKRLAIAGQVTDLQPISNLGQLEFLSLENNCRDWEAPERQFRCQTKSPPTWPENLRILDLSATSLDMHWPGLVALSGLESLELAYFENIKSIKKLEDLGKLRTLNLSGLGAIDDWLSLRNLAQLQVLLAYDSSLNEDLCRQIFSWPRPNECLFEESIGGVEKSYEYLSILDAL